MTTSCFALKAIAFPSEELFACLPKASKVLRIRKLSVKTSLVALSQNETPSPLGTKPYNWRQSSFFRATGRARKLADLEKPRLSLRVHRSIKRAS